MSERVLVVDDEPDLAAALCDALARHGFTPSAVGTLGAAREAVHSVELILLDLGLPDGDGLHACAELAAIVPVVVISARAEEADRVMALELGADDYLAKPFSTRELVARCRAVLRRAGGGARSRLSAADLTVDLEAISVCRGEQRIALTLKEFEVLAVLIRRPGRVVRRTELAAAVWNSDLPFVARSLEVHISSLRHKLGVSPDGGAYIETVQGIGYRFRP